MLALVPCPPSSGTSLEAQMVNQPAVQETRVSAGGRDPACQSLGE